jgi:hypothetical protein
VSGDLDDVGEGEGDLDVIQRRQPRLWRNKKTLVSVKVLEKTTTWVKNGLSRWGGRGVLQAATIIESHHNLSVKLVMQIGRNILGKEGGELEYI